MIPMQNNYQAYARVTILCLSLGVAGCSLGAYYPEQGAETTLNKRNNDLVFICGSKGMSVNFVTGACVTSSGQQVNPLNLYPPFQAPMPKGQPSDMIMRCQGRAVDFVTGRCM
jgi:hypothetical protein